MPLSSDSYCVYLQSAQYNYGGFFSLNINQNFILIKKINEALIFLALFSPIVYRFKSILFLPSVYVL